MKKNKVLHIILFYSLFISSLLIGSILLPKMGNKVDSSIGFGIFGIWFIIAGLWGNGIGVVFILSKPGNWTENHKLWNYLSMGLGTIFILYAFFS